MHTIHGPAKKPRKSDYVQDPNTIYETYRSTEALRQAEIRKEGGDEDSTTMAGRSRTESMTRSPTMAAVRAPSP